MASRINRAIELLAEGQAIYYVGAHTGHVLTAVRGCRRFKDLGPTILMSAWSMARST